MERSVVLTVGLAMALAPLTALGVEVASSARHAPGAGRGQRIGGSLPEWPA